MGHERTTVWAAAALAAAAVLAPAAALADGDDAAAAYEEMLAQLADAAVESGQVHADAVTERRGDRWLEAYDSRGHFERTERGMRAYLDRNLGSGGWNGANALNHIRIHNFETITGSVGDGEEITALVAEYERMQGTYSASEPVRRYHEWLLRQYDAPGTREGVMGRIADLAGGERFLGLAFGHAERFNGLAEAGSVPEGLFRTDAGYWAHVGNAAVCGADPACDPRMLIPGDPPQEGVAWLEDQLGFRLASLDIWGYLLPAAHAAWEKTYARYELFAYINGGDCVYNNCYESWRVPGAVGHAEIDVMNYSGLGRYSDQIEHIEAGQWVRFTASACSTPVGGNTMINSVEAAPYLANSLRADMERESLDVNACATASYRLMAERPWIIGIHASSDGSYYWQDR